MPPNATQRTGQIESELRKRNVETISKDSNVIKPKSKKVEIKKSSSKCMIFAKIIFITFAVFSLCVAGFFFLPWEEYVFTEAELQAYLSSMEQEEGGDWVMRQFLATTEHNLTQAHIHEVKCYDAGYRMERKFNASPSTCGLVITDQLVKDDEVNKLRSLAAKITEEIGYQSYANRESINLRWMNLHVLFRKSKKKNVLKKKDYQLLHKASLAAKALVSESFGIPYEQLHFYVVSQFTRYRSVVPFSEFRHVDKVRSPALIVTSILWLSTVDEDFGGGRVEFLVGDDPEPNTPLIVEPKKGRFAAWTSGWENPHGVMQINWGDRLALIFAFTVNPNMGYKDLDDLRQFAETNEEIEF